MNPAADKPVVRAVIHWMGGWVSSLECWEPQLNALFPEYEHRFLDTHSLLDLDTPPDWIESTPRDSHVHIIAAWSLGSLRVHRWMADGAWPVNVPVLSLCPVFRFVQPETSGTFGASILLRMEQKLGAEREAVLRDFWRRMPKTADMPPEWEAAWIAGTRRYDDASVLHALQYLRREAADPASLKSVPDRWELIAGEKDRLAPAGSLEAMRNNLPAHARLNIHPGGHIPFRECPGLVGESLRRLAAPITSRGAP
jgi:pimeloyl-ACP methyl ester carboxylesterase